MHPAVTFRPIEYSAIKKEAYGSKSSGIQKVLHSPELINWPYASLLII